MHVFEVFAHLFHPRRSNNHRPKLLHTSSYLSFAFLAVGVATFIFQYTQVTLPSGGVLGYASDIKIDQVVTQTNAERTAAGLAVLKYNEVLSGAARLKAADMFKHQYWAHTSPQGKDPWYFFKEAGYSYQSAGENLARDFATTPDMVKAWMASPTHKANIVHPKYQEIGVAVVNGTLQGVETTLVVQLFGSPKLTPAILPENGVSIDAPASNAQDSSAATTTQKPGQPAVLAQEEVVKDTSIPLVSPIQLMKAIFVAIVGLIIATLAYDAYISEQKNVSRMVGKNMAHIAFLLVVVALMIWVKSGTILDGINSISR